MTNGASPGGAANEPAPSLSAEVAEDLPFRTAENRAHCRAMVEGLGRSLSERSQPRRGWFGIPKAARDAIRRDYDGDEGCDAALSLHAAIHEVANDKGSDRFIVDQPWLAMKAGLSTRTLRRHLPRLIAAGVVKVDQPKLRGPAQFTIPTLGHNGRTSGQDGPTLGQQAGFAPCPTTEEHRRTEKESPKEQPLELPGMDSGELPFPTPEFRTTWLEWEQHVLERNRKKLGSVARAQQLKKLKTMGEPAALAALRQSMENNWCGIFQPHKGPRHSPSKFAMVDREDLTATEASLRKAF